MNIYQEIITEFKKGNLTDRQLAKLKRDLALKYKLNKIPTNIEILLSLTQEEVKKYKKSLLTKPTRTISGVAPVAIMTKPFPCPHGKCIMCPGGVDSEFGDVPQSYTGKEPATMRGIRNKYDPYLQVFNRLEQYILLGHNCEKVELILMGGTFPSFPLEYQEEFVKYAFKAMNDFSELFYDDKGEFDYIKFKQFFELPVDDLGDKKRVERIQNKLLKIKKQEETTLENEHKRNETAKIRCVALCIETRSDYGLLEHGNQMLRLGCTRVELGIQSVYDDVLKKIQRGHTTKDTKESIRILKNLGFKVAGHYMPGLPGVNKDKDLEGMKLLFNDPDYKPDMLKLYPCMVTKGTKLFEEYKKGKFKPLTADQAAELIVEFKKFIPEYCRVQRVQRDIPTYQIEAGVEMTNLRQYLHEKYDVKCRCIRCREPKGKNINWKSIKIKVNEYKASGGKEFFISAEDIKNDVLVGFCRLRFPSETLREEITKKSALIRELHVYGTATGIGDEGLVQHKGWGKKLMKKAEDIAKSNNKDKMVVISGVGVREYYKKLGYKKEGVFMCKNL
ncbi:MAG: tRNA uridine(34) 5-carboxymethylaminomethyl modification radical SAM/GNAT enzyme Elp3 [Nanoarchaeota archaeon]|nr:tRNA uridine(34) 5-carboxymethylaminomethyl modification radical SAM/GNAT enzyme Elp3 [Nanoarchaeota archaeon]MBU1632800.1 tRNA uridine(34) 5-carboxymethylaminomethyl modification radical SAM/GNAT enzyme Elp3 [Nanoarchaeota archaeon]MBU1876530.1 tRNA uridine(34) 5-carboxymethylaminomethyl modification radical SAM/GNAT enzyme Elp3 [Nanoarchaeota archaeon]